MKICKSVYPSISFPKLKFIIQFNMELIIIIVIIATILHF
jgi:hypothetical protein